MGLTRERLLTQRRLAIFVPIGEVSEIAPVSISLTRIAFSAAMRAIRIAEITPAASGLIISAMLHSDLTIM